MSSYNYYQYPSVDNKNNKDCEQYIQNSYHIIETTFATHKFEVFDKASWNSFVTESLIQFTCGVTLVPIIYSV